MTIRRVRGKKTTRQGLLLGGFLLPVLGLAATPVEAGPVAERAQIGPFNAVTEVRVSSGTDDAEERTDGSMYITSSDLELVTDIDRSTAVQRQMVGIRFAEVDVPAGATLTRVYLEFRADEDTSSDPTSLLIRGEASPESQTFSPIAGDVRARQQTASFVQWNAIEPWTTPGEAKQTTDLSAIVAEVISQPGWTRGGPITFLIDGYGRRVAKSFNGSPSEAPLLHIEYTVDAPVDPPTPPGNGAVVSPDVTLTSALNGENWSGLSYQSAAGDRPGQLWAVNNRPSQLTRIPDGYAPSKAVSLTNETGRGIDAEAVTIDAYGRIFVAAEGHEKGNPNAIYQYDFKYGVVGADGADDTAQLVRSWSFGNVGPNSNPPVFPDPIKDNEGIEALAWIPYSALGGASNPWAASGDSLPGFFAIGTETQGTVYLVLLYADDEPWYRVVGTVDTGLAGVMALEWDGKQLWAYCDNACDENPPPDGSPAAHFAIMEPNGQQLQTVGTFPTAPSLVGAAMEGFALQPVEMCDPYTGLRQAWWNDDAPAATSLATGFAARC